MKRFNCVLVVDDPKKVQFDDGREVEYTPMTLELNGVKIAIQAKKNSKDLLNYLIATAK